MTILLVILYVLVCLFLVMVVLLQQGKGADLAGAFGGGGSQTSFGPRAGSNIMHRMTTASFVLFVVLSMALAILSGRARSSVMEDIAEPPPVAATEEQVPAFESTEEAVPGELSSVPVGDAVSEEGAVEDGGAEVPAEDPPPSG